MVAVFRMHLLQTSNVRWSPEHWIAIDPNTMNVFWGRKGTLDLSLQKMHPNWKSHLHFLSNYSFELWLNFRNLTFPWGTEGASRRLRASWLEAPEKWERRIWTPAKQPRNWNPSLSDILNEYFNHQLSCKRVGIILASHLLKEMHLPVIISMFIYIIY